jgi:hypothetical protein
MPDDIPKKDPIDYCSPKISDEEFRLAWRSFGHAAPAPMLTPEELNAELEAKSSGVFALSEQDFERVWKAWGVKRHPRTK